MTTKRAPKSNRPVKSNQFVTKSGRVLMKPPRGGTLSIREIDRAIAKVAAKRAAEAVEQGSRKKK